MTKKRGHGEGSIYEQANGRWVAKLSYHDASGQRRRVKRTARTKTEARAKLRELMKLQEDGVQLSSGEVPVSKYLARWLGESVKSSVRPKTYEGYESIIRVRVNPHLGGTKLNNVTPAILQQLYADLSKSGLSARSIVHTHRVLHRAFKTAMRWGLIPRNPCEAVDPPRAQKNEMRTLSGEQVNVLLGGTVGDRQHPLYVLAVSTGMRLGELLGLRWCDVDLGNSRLFVRQSLQRVRDGLAFVEPKTSKSRRTVILGDRAVGALREHRQLQLRERLSLGPAWQDGDLVFANEVGGPKDPDSIAYISTHIAASRVAVD